MRIDRKLVDRLLKEAAESPRLRAAFDLRSNHEEGSQRILNVLLPGTIVPIHRHRKTDETAIVVFGRLKENFYSDNGVLVESHDLDASTGCFGLQIPKGVWHTVEVSEPCAIIEMKDGAYEPLSLDDIMS